MKSFILKLVTFSFLCISIDLGIGSILNYLSTHAKGGYTERENYITTQVNTDILIFGSSRAAHNYVPSILKDSLDMSSFNCGLDGHGVIYAYGKLKTVLSRFRPNVIIFDFISYLDLEKGDPVKDIAPLRPYYDYPGIDSLFKDIDKMERLKMLSHCYPYNSQFLQLVNDNYFNQVLSQDQGYLPLYGQMNYDLPHKEKSNKRPEMQEIKYKYMEYFIKEAQKYSQLIVFVSPTYGDMDIGLYEVLKGLCNNYQVPVYDYLNDTRITDNKELFVDPLHLNDDGAKAYTKLIISDLRKSLCTKELHHND